METTTENQNWSKLTLGAQALLIYLQHIHKPEDVENIEQERVGRLQELEDQKICHESIVIW